MSTLAVFGVLAGGTAYAANTIGSTDIIDGQVKSVDVGDGEIGSADVKDGSLNRFDVHSFLGVDVVDGTLTGADIGDGSLNDEDVGQAKYINFVGNIGTVGAQSCVSRGVTGIGVNYDHLLLTPSFNTVDNNLTYGIEYPETSGNAWIKACNPTTSPINDGNTNFNLLVIDGE